MSTTCAAAGAAMRRSTRSSARLAVTAGAPPPGDAAAAAEEAAIIKQPRKRQRRLAATAVVAAEEADAASKEVGSAAEAAVPAAKQAGRGAGKGGKAVSGPTRQMEEDLWEQGHKLVAGVDEAGRGPLAGPVVAACCVVPSHVTIAGIDDSKKLSAEQREAIYEQLTTHPDVLWAAKTIDAEEIDTINILQAALKAMEGAASGLPAAPDYLLVDGNRLPKGFDPERARPVVKGDSKCLCIAAASVIAKVTRDRLMEGYHQQYPQYNFAGHKGYCVPEHVEAIRQHGPCAVHRRTFAPIKHWFPLEPAEGEQEESDKGKRQGGAAKKGGRGSRRGKGAGA